MKTSKIKVFRDLLTNGATFDDAVQQSQVSKATAKIQYNLWKRGETSFKKVEPKPQQESQPVEPVEEKEEQEEEEEDLEIVNE